MVGTSEAVRFLYGSMVPVGPIDPFFKKSDGKDMWHHSLQHCVSVRAIPVSKPAANQHNIRQAIGEPKIQ